MLGDQADASLGQQLPAHVDIAPANVHHPADGGFEHIAAAKQLGLKLRGRRAGFADARQQPLHGFVTVTAAQCRLGRALAVGQHVMAHAADQQARMPDRNRHARAQQGGDAGGAAAKIKLTGVQEHGVGVGAGKKVRHSASGVRCAPAGGRW